MLLVRKTKTRKADKVQLIHQDPQYLIVNKPAGWITNDASTTTDQPVLQTYLRENFNYPISKNNELRSGIVHRLDKPTSGILIIAKTPEAFANLQEQFKQRKVQKTYLALAHGKVEPEKGTINVPVGRTPWNRRRFGVVPGSREARTDYEVEKLYKKDNETLSLVKLHPKTGRTHQIRVHLKHINHPIVSDPFYAGRKTSRKDLAWCPRLFLHASEITFTHPTTNKQVHYKADLPEDLSAAVQKAKLID